MDLHFIYKNGCEHNETALERLEEVTERLAPGSSVVKVDVESGGLGDVWRHLGTPTILVDGADIEGRKQVPHVRECRRYDGDGIPPVWMIEAAILRARRPGTLLFMCVANSARSQMAEGLASWLAPGTVTVRSAGSDPGTLNPYAVEAMAEIGIDISSHWSKPVDRLDIALDQVDALVTLCAGEVCPTLPGDRLRLHWALPDPAEVEGDGEDRLEAFRRARDTLMRRLCVLFRGWNGDR